MPAAKPKSSEIPARFQVAKRTLLMDRFMNQFIKIGGLSVIVAVFGIFLFILIQILPLFQGAKVEELKAVQLDRADYIAVGIDEWAEVPFALQANGTFVFTDLFGTRGTFAKTSDFVDTAGFGAAHYLQARQEVAIGTRDGRFSVVKLNYRPVFDADRNRTIDVALAPSPLYPIGPTGGTVQKIRYADAGQGNRKLAAALVEHEGKVGLHVTTLAQRRGLMGGGQIAVGDRHDLTPLIEGELEAVLAPTTADAVLVVTKSGEILYFFLGANGFELRQRFTPFSDLPDASLSLAEFIFGDVTLVAVSRTTGQMRGYSLYTKPHSGVREFGHTKTFETLPAASDVFAAGTRNKAFIVGGPNHGALMYSTTEATRWSTQTAFRPVQAVIGGKYDRMIFLDDDDVLHFYELKDPHPEASFKAFFGKLWYEGQPEPTFDWQSTGGSDDFEPKLSLVPLIIGSLKGTFYAMLFAVPIALLAAVYTSQFLRPSVKTIVKPTMEIMASLPSVVLGFLAALWLAPILDTRVPSILCLVLALPGSAVLFGWAWTKLPPRGRILIAPGNEFLVYIPVMFLVGYAAWSFGPVLEQIAFVVTDPATGSRTADFRLWWPTVTGTPYEQRNSMVVGFMMGFAVIPIIFTIAEDSLSNVPQALRSGSLALGASRWQTAFRIVLPTASAGIFSALMIGLGRAVGETMIVVMATGNTPIMEFNMFSGMRTLSANIAVELPEAPHHGTLYRTLFLGAMMLFLMTFAVNTLAEVLRQRLRDRYKTVE
jgi:phosphate transport system permease protein